jgi:hypothetical protein
VRGEQRMLGNVETTSDSDGTLHIGTSGMLLYHRQPLQVTLVLPSIEDVSVHGSGDSSINGFSGKRIDVNLSGSGNLKFNGRFKEVEANVQGSGELEMNGGASDKVEVSLAGSGKITVVGSARQFKAAPPERRRGHLAPDGIGRRHHHRAQSGDGDIARQRRSRGLRQPERSQRQPQRFGRSHLQAVAVANCNRMD